MKTPPRKGRRRFVASLLLLPLVVGGVSDGVVAADSQSDRRARVGLRLFPTFVAADEALERKLGPDGTLLILVIYRNDREAAGQLAERMRQLERIRDLPVRVEIVPYANLLNYTQSPLAAVFVSEWLPDGVDALVNFGRERKVIVFSPFEGDVQRGILGGMSVTDRILPYINMRELGQSGIELRSFFLDLARRYD